MESKKVNIFAFIMIIVMCVVSIYIGVKGDGSGINGLSAYEIACKYGFNGTEDEWLESLKRGNEGMSAYDIAVKNGFSGSEGEWLCSLNGDDGTNALATVTPQDIYEAYLDVIHKTSAEFSYQDFLVYYYSVMDSYTAKTATQIAYSSTVDICYSYSVYTCYVEQGTQSATGLDAYKVDASNTGDHGGVAAGAGVIYKMLDSDVNGELDTAYIITNYHVAYIENYCNNDSYTLYRNTTTNSYFIGTKVDPADILTGTTNYFPYGTLTYDYFLASSISVLDKEESLNYHFLNGNNGDFYGIYLYGYQTEGYKLNATFVGGSADNDIAVLKIKRSDICEELADIFFDSNMYKPANIGDSTNIVGGEDVIAVGNPLIAETSSCTTIEEYKNAYIDALCLSSTNGIVSVISNDCLFESLVDSSKLVNMRLIRVSAAINSGNSGGGLFDLYGNLIGIVNSKIALSEYDNVGYAIPINVASSIADQVVSQCDGLTETRIKVLKTKSIGFEIENGTSNSALTTDSNGNPEWNVSKNIIVKNIVPTSVSYVQGLRNDDIIKEISFDGVNYLSEMYFNLDYELNDLLLRAKTTCNQLKIKIMRNEAGSLVPETITIEIVPENFVEIV